MHDETGGANQVGADRPARTPIPAGSCGGPESKIAARAEFLAARRSMPAEARRAADAAVVGALTAALAGRPSVAAYLPFGTEPGASASPTLPQALADTGLRVLLPVLLADLDLDWAEHTGPDSLAPGRLGLLEPTGPRLGVDAVSQVSAVVAPAVAVDRSGVRLGRGGGSYDRALARVPAGAPVIALLYDGELISRLPAEPHDRHVTAVITPSDGLVWLP